MADFDLEFEGLTEFQEDLLDLAHDLNNGTHSKKFLRKEGSKFRTRVRQSFRSMGIGSGAGETKKIEKSFKRGRPYLYQGEDWSIRAYSSHPLTHLLNDGHMLVDRNGKTHGFSPGWHFMEKAKMGFENEYYSNVSDWLDELLDNEGL